MKILYIMQGIAGGGKSTLALTIAKQTQSGCQILSTDDYWYLLNPNVYQYDPEKLGIAHDWNQMRCRALMREATEYYNVKDHVLIIDNTNIKQRAAQPYIDMAKKFGYTVQVVRVECDPDEAVRRQQSRSADRQVPEEAIRRMYDQMERIVI